MKNKLDVKSKSEKRKKLKTTKTENEEIQAVKAEILDVQTLSEGMVLLGCVIEIRSNCFLMSLPGCLVGTVPLSNVSRKYTERIMHSTEDESDYGEADLASIVEIGAVFPCKVLQVTFKEKLKKPSIVLSIDPQVVNAELRLQSLYLKMVLHCAVQSVEDHGYVMDIGLKGVQGFLPFSASNGNKNLIVGQVIPTSVRKLPSHKKGNAVWLSKLGFNETFPEVEDENMGLTSILPGANVTAYVTEVKHPFLYMKCMNFEACACMMSLGSSNQNLTEANRVSGTVLYVHPITRIIYMLLGPKPTPDSFQNFFRVKKFDLLQNLKYQYFWHHKLLFKVHKGAMGFVKKGELPERGFLSQDSLSKNPILPKARVVFLHYMDNLVQLSLNESLINLEIVQPEDIQIGDIYDATVTKHIESGMFITVCPGFSGFVRHLHMSDVFVTMPHKLYPEGSKVKTRVLSLHSPTAWNLTCKDSLLRVPTSDLMVSYEQAQKENSYKGVIVQKADTHLVVLFFNNVKGVVPADEIPESSLFFVGQTVSCQVLQCDPVKKKLKLSLMGDTHSAKNNVKNAPKKPTKQKLVKPALKTLTTESFDPRKPHKAVIKSITGSQLNIIVDGSMRGRVHITELGHSEENSMPLKNYASGQRIKVHILSLYSKKCGNFLEISHRKMKQFLECSLEYPPPVPLEREFLPEMSITGFVKETNNTSATLWLSPVQTASLDYLHVSENPKVLRKLKKRLKVGLTVNANVLDAERKSKDKNYFYDISLTKLGNKLVKSGCNAVGLVQIACPEKGLVLKLPLGYHGAASLTDLQDVFSGANAELTKCRKLGFILCHVLEVNHSTKFCVLSLRKSRLYNYQPANMKGIYPEITLNDVDKGKHIKGFIKLVSNDHLIVNFGRMLNGKASLHKCSSYGCTVCKYTQGILQKYSPGDVIETVVDGVSATKNLYPLLLPELAGLGILQQSRLSVTKDIDWNDA